MISVRRRALTRLAATAAATGLLAGGAIATAGTAVADENVRNGGATATLGGLETYDGVKVGRQVVKAGLFTMDVHGGGTVKTYCIDFMTGAKTGYDYKEANWDATSLAGNADAGKIHWVLQNSYPRVDDLNALSETVGLKKTLTKEQAAAGTQAAIWKYSDNKDAQPTNKNAQQLTQWLLDNAVPVEQEPAPSLELDTLQVSGKPGGEPLGPVTVTTSAETVTVTPDASAAAQGVSLVDGEGNLVTDGTPVTNGTQLFFDVPEGAADGSTSFTATVTTKVLEGRAFTGMAADPTQTMILAGSSDVSAKVEATATWKSEGPNPTFDAREDCVDGGVEVVVNNSGDQPFDFTLDGNDYSVPAGGEQKVLVSVENKQEYRISIVGADGEELHEPFTGVLDCATGGDEGETEGGEGGKEIVEDNDPAPATTGGQGGGEEEEPAGSDDPNLAETGSSTSPGLIAGIAVALLVAGGGAMFFLRRKNATAAE
ncbi:thioester domain-containing protein [Streptomyces sp. ACA25]|uniref:thioester domain-containing protein n=1 Tax=Streptomyces sp. ACA25 TaxID=3022596 RepID=UPI0023072898|nr:thioester domain-containing protein [Streptomyces sp. ACA25]MDB1086762.1 thioester domain-containing protein [Streptomyces sp. ACA25]